MRSDALYQHRAPVLYSARLRTLDFYQHCQKHGGIPKVSPDHHERF